VPASASRRISVVVPCYNRAAYLQVLLQSMTWSAVPPSEFEVVVVNDGGVDHVELVAETWRRRGLDVRVLSLRAGGPPETLACARHGIRSCSRPIRTSSSLPTC
jgi:cellulose synthase/poly-beta-1,6-N-acetylglucosamine synthase-like glycosyltransferase